MLNLQATDEDNIVTNERKEMRSKTLRIKCRPNFYQKTFCQFSDRFGAAMIVLYLQQFQYLYSFVQFIKYLIIFLQCLLAVVTFFHFRHSITPYNFFQTNECACVNYGDIYA